MKTVKRILTIFLLLLALTACQAAEEEATVSAPATHSAAAPVAVPLPGKEAEADAPGAIVHAFYGWYTEPNHLGKVLGSDHERYLSPRLRQVLADFHGNFDPILLAQEHLQAFTVESWYQDEGEAGVLVHFALGEGTHDLTIRLVAAEGEPPWQIDRIEAGNLATAAGVAERFYRDYIGLYQAETDPLASGRFREMAALGPAFVEAVDALRAEGIDYDPILMAEAPPQRCRVDEVEATNDRATVVLLCWWTGEQVPSPLTVTLAGRGHGWAITGVDAPAVVAAPPAAPPPEAVVESFFEEYLAAGGFGAGAYRENAALHPVYVAALAEQAERWQTAGIPLDGYDPLLQTAADEGDLGGIGVSAGRAVVALEKAEVQVWRDWKGAQALPLTVSLQRTPDGTWQIVDVSSIVRPLTAIELAVDGTLATGVNTPAGLVAELYTAALAYGADRTQAQEVGERLGLPVAPEAVTFCGPGWPRGVAIDSAFIQPDPRSSGEIASVVVRTSFEHHLFTVELARSGGEWAVTGVTCGDTPAGRAFAFYTWYLGSIGEAANYRLGNPYLDGRYAASGTLTPEFVAEVDAMRAAGAEDPFLPGERAPISFTVEAGPAQEQATVRLRYGEGREQTVIVSAEAVGERWLLAGIEVTEAADLAPPAAPVTVDTSGWITYTDAAYPFSFRVPPGWVVDVHDLPGMEPAAEPEHVLAVYTPEVAAAQAAGAEATASGWPSGLPVVNVSVIEGEGEVLEQAFVPPVASHEVSYNGYPVLVQQEGEEYTVYRYVFHHPQRPLWVVFVDTLSAFPGREAYAAEVEGMLPGMLSTVTFGE